jgi:hypothetical protein
MISAYAETNYRLSLGRARADNAREAKVNRYVTSTGGPLIIMEARLYETWGGTLSNSASMFPLTDYDFACNVDKYISIEQLNIGQILILGDMPMDTAVVQDRSRNATHLIRVMYGEIADEYQFISSNYQILFASENEIPSESFNNILFGSSHMILADSSDTAAFSLGDKHHLFFELGAPKCHIRTFDYKSKDIRVILHTLRY